MTASQLAREAAALISARGLAKHTQHDGNGQVCWAGALSLARFGAFGEQIVSDPDCAAVAETCARILRASGEKYSPPSFAIAPDSFARVVHYNNNPRTTGEDMILLLKEAGNDLESEGR